MLVSGRVIKASYFLEKKPLALGIWAPWDSHDPCLFSTLTGCRTRNFLAKVLEVSPNVNVEVHIDKAPINVHPKCHRPFRWNNPTSLGNSTYTWGSHLKFGSPLYYAFEGVRTSNPRREGFKIKKETPSKCDTLLGYLDGTFCNNRCKIGGYVCVGMYIYKSCTNVRCFCQAKCHWHWFDRNGVDVIGMIFLYQICTVGILLVGLENKHPGMGTFI